MSALLTEEEPEEEPGFLQKSLKRFSTYQQGVVDRLAPFKALRWFITCAFLMLYILRVYYTQGFHVISYALAIYILSLFISAISPKVDPAFADILDEAPTLPTNEGDEFRPFIPRLFEQKFWLSATRAIVISIFCTFFPFLDIPVFWPILVLYFIMLFIMMMKRQIKHMIRYRYVPFSYGKPQPKASDSTIQKA